MCMVLLLLFLTKVSWLSEVPSLLLHLQAENLTEIFSLNAESLVKLYGMGKRTFSWEVLSNLGMRWDSGSAGWTVRALSRARHRSGWISSFFIPVLESSVPLHTGNPNNV